MRHAAFHLLLALFVVFAVNCGSGSSGTGTGGAGGNHATGGAGGGAGGTTGTGGDHATGGAAGGGHGGSGGTAGSGGATGTGGEQATGGAGGGGHAGTGGATGIGGEQGTGGAGGGGHAGTGGQGGQGVDSGVSCADLASEYAAALPAALACTPGGANQCQQLEPRSLGSCADCKRYVNDATALTPIVDQWTAQGCGTSGPICTIACIAPGAAGNCVITDGAAPGGSCAAGPLTP